MALWKWAKTRGDGVLTAVLLVAAGILILIALSHSTKLKALAVVDLSPL